MASLLRTIGTLMDSVTMKFGSYFGSVKVKQTHCVAHENAFWTDYPRTPVLENVFVVDFILKWLCLVCLQCAWHSNLDLVCARDHAWSFRISSIRICGCTCDWFVLRLLYLTAHLCMVLPFVLVWCYFGIFVLCFTVSPFCSRQSLHTYLSSLKKLTCINLLLKKLWQRAGTCSDMCFCGAWHAGRMVEAVSVRACASPDWHSQFSLPELTLPQAQSHPPCVFHLLRE